MQQLCSDFAKVFGGTGYNIFNVALIARAFLFFAYPSHMSGDQVFVRTAGAFGMNAPQMVDGVAQTVDGFSGATLLGQLAVTDTSNFSDFAFQGVAGAQTSIMDMFLGFIPGSVGEVSTLAILIGAAFLIVTGVGSWKTMLSVFLGGGAAVLLVNQFASNAVMGMPLYHFVLGGLHLENFVFMATDPVTSARTEKGKWIYGFLIGALAVAIRVFNPVILKE